MITEQIANYTQYSLNVIITKYTFDNPYLSPDFSVKIYDDTTMLYSNIYDSAKEAYVAADSFTRNQRYATALDLILAADEMHNQTKTSLQLPPFAHINPDETAALQDYADHMRICANISDYLCGKYASDFQHTRNELVDMQHKRGMAWKQEEAARYYNETTRTFNRPHRFPETKWHRAER